MALRFNYNHDHDVFYNHQYTNTKSVETNDITFLIVFTVEFNHYRELLVST